MTLTISHFDRIDGSGAEKLFFEGWNFAVQDDLLVRPNWFDRPQDMSCLVAFEGREPVGILCFYTAPKFGAWRIAFVYVEQSSEGQGVARSMLQKLRQRAKDALALSLIGETAIGSKRIIDILKQEGAVNVAYTWTIPI